MTCSSGSRFRPDRKSMRTSTASGCTAYVVEQANIARRYRDQGHPKFWGRIIGTSADAEDADWMLAKFKAAGLTDVRIAAARPRARSGFRSPGSVTLIRRRQDASSLESAQPDYATVGTPADGTGPRSGLRRPRQRGRLHRQGRQGEGRVRVHDARRPGTRAPCVAPTTRVRPRSSKSTCCLATCGIRPIPRGRRGQPSPSVTTTATRRAS